MSANHPRPKVPCVRCNKNHDTPAAFLMACAKCERAWHHTCHIPQVSEEEILERITFDNQGKREAGLAGWQCKRCTKRARVEPLPPAAVPSGLSASSATSKPAIQSEPSLNRHSTFSVKTTSSVPPQENASATTQVTVADDDDIIILDEAPEPSQRPVVKLGNTPEADIAPRVMVRQPRLPSKSPAPQSTPAAASKAPRKPCKTIKMSKTIQKRPTKSILNITPLPATREPPAEEPLAGPSTHITNHTPRLVPSPSPPPPPLPPEPQLEQAQPHTRSPTPVLPHQPPIQWEPTVQHISFSGPPSTDAKTISTADIRALISTMRLDGRLAPPPEVEYVHTRTGPRPLSTSKQRQSGARKLPYAGDRARSPGLDGAAMDVDRTSGPSDDDSESDAGRGDEEEEDEEDEEEEDPHNIDDLYGDIAPRYRSSANPARRSKSRSKTAAAAPPSPSPPPEQRMLIAKRDKRPPKEDDLGLLVDKKLRSEGLARAPRKASMTQRLRGKALRTKQETGLYFSIHEERRRAAGG